MRNMEKPFQIDPALAGPRQADRKAGPGETAWRGSNKPRPLRNRADTPTSIWSLFARESTESSLEEMQMTIDLHRSIGAADQTRTAKRAWRAGKSAATHSELSPKGAQPKRPPTSIAKLPDWITMRPQDATNLSSSGTFHDRDVLRKARAV